MKKYIPNFVTLINLFCGCCALASVLYGQFVQAFWFSFASGIADFLDGLLARKLNVKSPIGKDLDSLADMVSFGVVPGAVIYMLLVKGLTGVDDLTIELTLVASPAFLVTVFSALRLAVFNNDTRQTEDFIGLNTPSCALFTMGLMLIYHFDSFGLASQVTNPIFLFALIPALCFLLVSDFPMFGFKFKNLAWKGNEIRFIFIILSIILLFLLKEVAFSIIIIIYILFAMINNRFLKTN